MSCHQRILNNTDADICCVIATPWQRMQSMKSTDLDLIGHILWWQVAAWPDSSFLSLWRVWLARLTKAMVEGRSSLCSLQLWRFSSLHAGSLGDSWSEKQYNCLQPAANEHPDWASSHFITFVLPLNFYALCNHTMPSWPTMMNPRCM